MALATEATLDMRVYKLTSSLLPFCLSLGGCVLTSIDPDEIDVADEVGEADGADESEDDVGTGDGDGDESGTDTADEGTTTDDTSIDTDDGDTETETSDDPDATDDAEETSGDSSEATTGGECEDIVLEGECGACVVDNCCDAILECQANAACDCTYACLGEGGTEEECAQECGAGGEAELLALAECTVSNCSEECL